MVHDRLMTTRRIPEARAFGVHLLTATGALFAMLAMVAAAEANWSTMFLWLLVAFAVDGIDGPLARRWDVKRLAPQVDGALLDLIVDYLTYVFIPAYALFNADLLPGWTAWAATLTITFASVVYFADTRMKTEDASFSGFPACWNMVVVVLFATAPPPWLILTTIVILSALMFTRLRFVHPVRTRTWRPITLPITTVWVLLAALAAFNDFALAPWLTALLVATSFWLLGSGALQQALGIGQGR